MRGDRLFSAIPRLIAVFGVLPFLLLLAWLTWVVAARSIDAQARWPLVPAQVVSVTDTTVTLQIIWHGDMIRGEVKREGSFADLAPLEAIQLHANPENPAEVLATGFDDLWGGTVTLLVFDVLLFGVFLFLMLVKGPGMPRHALADDAREPAFTGASPRRTREDDGSVIEVREPRQSWKANLFWGLALGLPLAVPALLDGDEASPLARWSIVALGFGWIAFMAFSAWRNFGRTVRCDAQFITVTQALGSRRIPLLDVAKVAREDVRKALRDLGNIGVSQQQRARSLDTMAPMIVYVLYDKEGKQLLRLDRDMEPASEMERLLARLQVFAGSIG